MCREKQTAPGVPAPEAANAQDCPAHEHVYSTPIVAQGPGDEQTTAVDFLSPYARCLARWDAYLVCPVAGCGGENHHIYAVAVNRGGAVVVIEGDEPPRTFTTHPTGRGSSVWIEFLGECGHRWALHFQFHKGAVFYAPEVRGEIDDWPATFWRD